jgi:16S rRNA A1518/A1519 N6-dimethyltransferase RsmA/KsgA/DIM1 with predicted DNA glycosylase/AP lyase activity
VRLVHALFAARRKTVRNGISSVPGVGRARADEVCARAGVDSRRRPETLAVAELRALAEAI